MIIPASQMPDEHLIKILKNRGYKVTKPLPNETMGMSLLEFDEFTKHIPQVVVPDIKIKNTLESYLEEYNKILVKKSTLNYQERIYVKNVINSEVRTGRITLRLKEEE